MAAEHQTEAITISDAYIRHVAHDLRASLNTVVGWAELVKAGHLSAEDTARAGVTIVRHARQLSQRLADALDAWRADAGLLQVDVRRSPVAAAVRAAVEQSQPALESRQVTCDLAIDTDAVAVFDPARLVQALGLLLSDAVGNSPVGDHIAVTVTDTGDGVIVGIIGGGRLPGPLAFESNPTDTRPDPAARTYNFALPLARTLITRQGGTLRAEPAADGARVRFVVCVPSGEQAEAQSPYTAD